MYFAGALCDEGRREDAGMKRSFGIVIVASALLAVAAFGSEVPGGPCCACIELSGGAQPAIPAFFCGFFPGPELGEAEARCESIVNATAPGLFCTNATASRCVLELAGDDIACPPSAGAPLASTTVLATLVAVLAAAGILRARRSA